jgi:hypothetical protein
MFRAAASENCPKMAVVVAHSKSILKTSAVCTLKRSNTGICELQITSAISNDVTTLFFTTAVGRISRNHMSGSL